jgi:outer membrane protein, multidrug efflux system
MKPTHHTLLYLTALLSILLLDSCRVGKNYQRPDLPLPAQFRSATPSDSSVADIPWRQFFADTTLQQLIDRGLSHNLNMQLALKRVEAANAYAKQARAAILPSVGLNLSAATNIPSNNSLNGISLETFMGTNHLEDYTGQLTFAWEIDIWGKIRRQKEAAVAEYLQSQEAVRAVKTQQVSDVAQSYFNLLMLDQQLTVARQNQALSDTIVQMMQLQKTAGEVTELAVQQAISQQQTASLLIAELEQEIAVQENIIRILIGELPAPINQPVRLSDFQVSEQFHTGIPARAISNRPDVRATELALVAANARVGVAQGSMYPALSITAGGGLNAFRASEWFTVPGSLFGTVAGNLAQPIFYRRALKTQLEVATIRREEAVLHFRQTVLDAVGEVSNALVRLEKLNERQQIATDQVDLQQAAVKNARMLFQSGLANYLEVITAQSSTLRAELNLATIKRQQLDAMVDLYRSLGGGWK